MCDLYLRPFTMALVHLHQLLLPALLCMIGPIRANSSLNNMLTIKI